MATLTGKKIKNTYKDLLQVSNSNAGIDSTLRAISDGEATDSVLQISSSAINISSAGALQYAGTAITSTAAELNILDGVTSTTAELNILDGVTATAAELNIMDGVTATTAELNYTDGVTSNIQTQLDSKIEATLTTEQVEDIVGGMLDGTETGISVSYDDTDGNIDFVVATQTDNNFTTTLKNKLDAIEASATADQTNAEIRTAVEAASDSNVFTDSDHSKLNAIEASADVTDATNVTAAGALMDSELSSIADVKALDQSVVSGASPNFITTNMTDASNKRFMTDAQETKLDSVESNATADQTDEEIQDVVGAMFSSNTETGITATYQDGDGTIDLVVGTLNQDTTGTAAKVTVSDSTANTNFPVIFHDESNALLDDTGALRYNPSTGTLLVPNLSVAGTTTTVDTVTMEAANAIIFEGATADSHETTLSIIDPTGDRTISLPNVSGTIPVLAAASTTQISSTPEELNILDGKAFLDEDDFASDSATGIASQQSIKAYIDSEVVAAGAGDITTVTAGDGLTGGATSGAATLNIGAGTGIDVAADAISVDVSDFMANGSNNRILTATGTDAMNAEANLTFDGTNLDLPDSKKVRFGTDNDFEFYHDDTNAVINNTKGDLQIYNNADDKDIVLLSDDGSGGTTAYLTLDGSEANIDIAVDTYFETRAMFSGGLLQLAHSTHGYISNTSGHLFIRQQMQDGDIYFEVNDGGSTINAIQIDASDNGSVFMKNDNQYLFIGAGNDIALGHNGTNSFFNNNTGTLQIRNVAADTDMFLSVNDGGSHVNAIHIDASDNARVRLPIDNQRLSLGASDDIQITHDGTNSYFDNYTGDLIIKNNEADKDIILKSDDGSGGETAYLTLDGSQTRTNVSKDLRLDDSVNLQLGGGGNMSLSHDGSNATFSNATGNLTIQTSTDDGDVILKSDDGSGGTTAYITLDGSATSIEIGKKMQFPASHSADKIVMYSGGNEKIGTEANTLLFTADNYKFKDTNGDDNLFINSSGNVLIGGTSASGHTYNLEVLNDNAYVQGPDGWNGNGDLAIVALGSSAVNENFGCGYKYGTGLILSTYKSGGNGTFGSSSYDALTILDTSGNVGIGTTSPSVKLVIDGGGDADADAGDASEYSLLINQDNNDKGIAFGFNGADNKIGAAIIAKGSGYNSNNKTDLQFYVKGTTGTTAPSNVMTLQAGGNVGIGTSSPATKLHINDSGANGIVLKASDNSENSPRIFFDGTSTSSIFQEGNDLSFRTGATTGASSGTERMLINSSGNVGIGEANPTFGLQIDGADFSGDAFKITRGTSAFTILNANNDYGVLGMESDHDLQIRTNGTTRMTIDNDGKVGIGITPSANLDVAGSGGSDGAAGSPTIRLSNTVASGDWDTGDVVGTIEYYAHDTSGNAPYVTSFIKSVNETNNGTLPGGALTFGVADYDASGGAAEAMRINEDGNVGIGTTSPSFKLKVNVTQGTYTSWETIAGFQAKRSADGETEAGIMINSLGDALGGQISSNWYWSNNTGQRANTGRSSGVFGIANSTTTNSEFYWQTTPHNSNTQTTRMELDGASSTLHVDGDVVAYSTTTSDARLKDNVKTIDNGLDKIMKLRGVEFDWNATSRKGQHDIGVIAQEVEEVIPEVVREKEFKVGEFTDNKQTFKTVDYEKIVGVLIEAIKEQQVQIDELKTKIGE